MITIRPAAERGRTRLKWLDSRHTFSFGQYRDPEHMGFGPLRVINDDRVIPGAGFGEHSHADMEIISYVLDGALEHQDSLGNGSIIRPGDVQRMSAGTGVTHSEFNASAHEPVHFLQIWIIPERGGFAPGYEQKHFTRDSLIGRLRLVGDRDGSGGAIAIRQDVRMYAGVLQDADALVFEADPDRRYWLHVASGSMTLNGTALNEGDGASAVGERRLDLRSDSAGEVLLFDLP